MNTLNTFNGQGETPFVFNGKKPKNESGREPQPQGELQWRRVLDVILVEGEIRYVVERGE
jgi:hypothetical protein